MTLYLVFAYDQYYPSGGMGDCEGVFTDPRAAWAKVQAIMAQEYSHSDYLLIEAIEPDGTWGERWDRDNLPEHNAAFLALVAEEAPE